MEPVPLAETRSCLWPPLLTDPAEWSAPPAPRVSLWLPGLCKGRESWGRRAYQPSWSWRPGAPRPREPLGSFPSTARVYRLFPPPPPVARPLSLPLTPPAGARTPGLRHVGAREAAAAAAAAGAQARAGEIALHAAGAAAVFCSAFGRSRVSRAGEAAEGKRNRTGALWAGAIWALSKGRPQPRGGSPAFSLAHCSCRR